MNRYENKKVLITGGASGIGRAICHRLASEGAQLVFIDRNAESGKSVEKELEDSGKPARFIKAELTNEKEVEEAFTEAEECLNRIDVLINNAGASFGENYEETTVENWNADIALNLTAHYMLTRLVLPGMVQQGSGAVTSISSVNGIQALGNPAYSAAKAGLISFTQTLAIEFAPRVASLTSIMSSTGDRSLPNPSPEAMAVLMTPSAETREAFVEQHLANNRVVGADPDFFAFEKDRLRERAGRLWDYGIEREGTTRQMLSSLASGDRTSELGKLSLPALLYTVQNKRVAMGLDIPCRGTAPPPILFGFPC